MKRIRKAPCGRARLAMLVGGAAALLLLALGVAARRLAPPKIGGEPWNEPDGVTVSILGDSISTFKGYIPTEDGVNRKHAAFYPNRDLRRVEDTWWAQVIDRMDGRLGVNESWSGSRVLNTMDGNEGNLGEDAAMASMTRIRNLGSNGTPQVILFFGGTNDISFGSPLGVFDPDQAPREAELTATKWETFSEAYTAAILRMQHLYPQATIYALSPTENLTHYDAQKRDEYVGVMREICRHYNVPFIDLTEEGFSTAMLADGTHPSGEGMACIADIVLGHCSSEGTSP